MNVDDGVTDEVIVGLLVRVLVIEEVPLLDDVLVGVLDGVFDGVLEGVFEGVLDGVSDIDPDAVLEGVFEGVLDGVLDTLGVGGIQFLIL